MCCAMSLVHSASSSGSPLVGTHKGPAGPVQRPRRAAERQEGPLMSANVGENASPFVDQLADGPGVSRIDPTDPAAPMYRLLALMRSPVALRDLMLQPVRTGYIGQEKPIDPAELPKSAAQLYPDIRVSELDVPSPLGRVRCQVFSPPGAAGRRAMMLYAHGGGSTVGGDGARIAVGGDSAGGNIAAALPLKARDAGLPVPQAAVLLAPITDFFFEQYESFERLAPLGIVYDTAFIGFIRGAYLVHGRIGDIRTPARRVP